MCTSIISVNVFFVMPASACAQFDSSLSSESHPRPQFAAAENAFTVPFPLVAQRRGIGSEAGRGGGFTEVPICSKIDSNRPLSDGHLNTFLALAASVNDLCTLSFPQIDECEFG